MSKSKPVWGTSPACLGSSWPLLSNTGVCRAGQEKKIISKSEALPYIVKLQG